MKPDHIGTCPVLQITTDSQGYEYCLAECLDYDGCMGATYMPNSQICLFHACDESNSTSEATGMTFVQRVCDLECKLTISCQAILRFYIPHEQGF